MDMRVREASGAETVIPEADWENLVHLLDHAGVDLVKLVSQRRFDAEEALKAGEMLGGLKLECVETKSGVRIRGVGGQDTDPVLSIAARLAEKVGDDETAEKARKILLTEMSTLVVRPLSADEAAKVESWVTMLTRSGGVELLD